ncbi:hypothetical protein [Pseudoramibacter alactolyticus]|uniref:hypothetical protein n=1 Tax=Pseudoramibacter alactolyticus TaxID=113287 RepID=UPI00248D3FA2|nr:hypothetical protein [Pseudoramibacter alactolyticus]
MTKDEIIKIKWLKQYHILRGQAADCEERIKELRDQLYNQDLQAQRITGMPHGGSMDSDITEILMDRIDGLIHGEIYIKRKAVAQAESIHRAIGKIDDPGLQWLLGLRYLQWDSRYNRPLTWHQIGRRMGYERAQLHRLHHRALSLLQLPGKDDTP